MPWLTRPGKAFTLPVIGDLTDPDGLGRAVRDHLNWLRLRNYSESTLAGRAFYLKRFVEWCAERSLSRPTEVSRQILERYRQHLFHRRTEDGRPLSARNQYMHLHAVRMMFRWAVRQNRVLYNPAADLELPRLEKRLPRNVLTAREAEAVLARPNLTDPLGLRDRAVLEVLYSTGIRRLELCCLTVWDLDRELGTVLVRQGKGKKDRYVPIGERAVVWVDRYLADARPLLVFDLSEDALFLTKRGEPLNPAQLSQAVGAYIAEADVGKRGGCHLFRHTCATLMLEGGADIRYIQELLGHSSIVSTQVYTRVSIRKLKQVHNATHPAALNRRAVDIDLDSSEEELLSSLARSS
ncbi:MAG: site-specific tyrosine recombinase XerC [Steroidobacteraceae bacterium]